MFINKYNERKQSKSFTLIISSKPVAMAKLDLFACFILSLKLILLLCRVTHDCQNVYIDRYDLTLLPNDN